MSPAEDVAPTRIEQEPETGSRDRLNRRMKLILVILHHGPPNVFAHQPPAAWGRSAAWACWTVSEANR